MASTHRERGLTTMLGLELDDLGERLAALVRALSGRCLVREGPKLGTLRYRHVACCGAGPFIIRPHLPSTSHPTV